MRENFSFTGLAVVLILAVLILAVTIAAWFLGYLDRQAPPSYTRLVTVYQIEKGVNSDYDCCQDNRISGRIT